MGFGFKILFMLTTAAFCLGEDSPINFIPELSKDKEEAHVTVFWNTTFTGVNSLKFSGEDDGISEIIEYHVYDGDSSGNFTVSCIYVGINKITVTFLDSSGKELGDVEYETKVTLKDQLVNDIFTNAITVLLAVFNLNMGATLQLDVVKKIAKAPIGPAIGMFCQYGLMPVIAYVLGLIFFPNDSPLIRLGLFLGGTCPGGGGSNMYTILLGGNLDLSIMMTFCSVILAFVALPLWVLTLGPVILGEDSDITIPFGDIALTIVLLAVPMGIGIVIQYKCKRLQRFLEKMLSPFALFNILFTFSFGIYSNRYIFYYFNWRVIVSGMGLPWIGYFSGMLIAYLLRQELKNVITIGIETGLQNTLIAYVILKTSFSSPEGDIGFVVPACSTLMMPFPLFAAIAAKKLYLKFHKGNTVDINGKVNPAPATQNDISIITEKPKAVSPDKPLSGVDNPAAEFDDVQHHL